MASIKKRGKVWGYSVSLGFDVRTKKQIQKTKSGFVTKAQAKKAAEIVEYKYKHEGGILSSTRSKFSEVVEDWLNVYEQSVKPGTLYLRKKAVQKVLPTWGNKHLIDINSTAYQNFITSLSKEYSRNYVESIHGTLNLIFKFGQKQKLIFESPCEKVVFKKNFNDKSFENFLEKKELKAFLKVAESTDIPSDFLIFYTLSLTGLRIGELLALRWEDIDIEQKTISVNHTMFNPKNNMKDYLLVSPKTKKSKRIIPMADTLVNAFIDYRIHVEGAGEEKKGTNFVFFRNENDPLTNTFVRNRLVFILRNWGYGKHITLHSFRHTFASLLIEQGVSVINVSELLGHSDTTITTKTYTHLTQPRHLEMQSSLSKFGATLEDAS